MLRRADHDVETTDWRAVCGRTARTVRRAGIANALPDPYPIINYRLMDIELNVVSYKRSGIQYKADSFFVNSEP